VHAIYRKNIWGNGMADEISIVLDRPLLCFDLNIRTPTRHLPTFHVLPLYLCFVPDIYQFLKKTRIKLYSTLALPVLICGSETWSIKASDARRITAAEMKYLRRTAG